MALRSGAVCALAKPTARVLRLMLIALWFALGLDLGLGWATQPGGAALAAEVHEIGEGDLISASLDHNFGPGRYLVEFRARHNTLTGHAYVTISKPLAGGRKKRIAVFGFYPTGGTDAGLQALVGIAGMVGSTQADRLGLAANIFVLHLEGARLQRVMAVARTWRRRTFDLFGANCNAFIADVAHAAGLRTPATSTQLPVDFIAELAALNDQQSAESVVRVGGNTPTPAMRNPATSALADAHNSDWLYQDDELQR